MLSSRHICSKTAVRQMFGQPSEDLLEELETRENSLLCFKGLSQTTIKNVPIKWNLNLLQNILCQWKEQIIWMTQLLKRSQKTRTWHSPFNCVQFLWNSLKLARAALLNDILDPWEWNLIESISHIIGS